MMLQNENNSPVSEDLIPGSEKLFLFFGGIAGAIGMPPFEFYRASRILEYSKIFLRDASQAWYQRGLPGIGDDVHAVGDYLRNKIKASGAAEIIFIGNSMGGFAALLFCAMLQMGEAIAFSPQTFISSEKRSKYGEDRWPEQIERLHGNQAGTDILDLRPWVQTRFPQMPARLYVSTADELDVHHAGELADFPNIEIQYFPDGGHGLVTKLRDDGVLGDILIRERSTPT